MTRQRLGAGRAAVAEDGGGQETTARTSHRQRLFVEHDLVESSGSTVDVALSWVSINSRTGDRRVQATGECPPSNDEKSEP